MRRVVLLFLLLGSTCQAKELGEAEGPMPFSSSYAEMVFKVRVLPLMNTLSSSINAMRFNHSLWIDAEYFPTPQASVAASLAHSRLSIGGFDASDDYDYYYNEFQTGVVGTFYLNPSPDAGTLFVRTSAYLHWMNTDLNTPPENGEKGTVNMAKEKTGVRIALEGGWAIRNEPIWFEVSTGLAVYLRNPYSGFNSMNKHGIPPWMSNVFFGLSDVYPTLNAALGIAI